MKPPRLASWLVRCFAPRAIAEDVLADLEEGLDGRQREHGALRAGLWYWRQLFSLDWLRLHQELERDASAHEVRRRSGWEELMMSIWQDIRYAVRSLASNPGFTTVVVLTLALGIGANVALVSVVRSVVLTPLPYGAPERVVSIWSQWSGFPKTWVSVPEYRVYRESFESFEAVGLYRTTSTNLTGDSEPERVGLGVITPNVFDVLGVSVSRGRGFTVEESRPALSDVVVVSDPLWRRRYGGDPELIGRRIEVDGVPRTVIGILPAAFRLPNDFTSELPLDIYLPLNVPDGIGDIPTNGGNHGSFGVARLAPGITAAQAQSEALAWNRQAVTDGFFTEERRFRTLVIPVDDDVIGQARTALFILLVAVGFVLLIACVNVANLVLSRGRSRSRELALRTALGAGFGRVFRQLMTESLVLASFGGVVAVVFAEGALRLLIALEPGTVPRLGDAGLDATMLGFTALATFFTALLFGALPAFAAARSRLSGALAVRSSGGASRGQGLGGAMVAFQLAVAVVLVMAAGLMIRTFSELVAIDPGFRSENVLTLRLQTPAKDYPENADVIAFYRRLLEEIREVPGVESAGAIRNLPLAAQIGDWGTRIEGYEPEDNESTAADWQVATDGYFEAMGLSLVEGRLFSSADRVDSEPAVIVNEAFAKRYWPNESAVGQRIMMRGADEPPWNRIVGVVGNVRHNGITAEIKGKWYRPHAQFHHSSGFTPAGMTLTIRASVPPESLAAPVRNIVHGLDPNLPLAEVRSLDDVLSGSMAQSRFMMALLVLFSSLALVLAAVGVYGVIAYGVSQRTIEFGVRLAMGSTPSRVLRMVVGQGLVMSGFGIVVGAAVSVGLTRYMESVLYGVEPRDPVTFVLVPLVLLAAGLLGCAVPAWRASRIDPVSALRGD